MMPKTIFMILVIVSIGSACSHDVYIRSNPNGAKIYVNDEFIGKSPTVYEEQLGRSDAVEIKAEKEGYKTKRLQLVKSGWAIPQILASVGGCVCGGLCCSNFLSDIGGAELGAIGLLGGLPALSAIYFAHKSDDNIYLKLSPVNDIKAPKFKTKIPVPKLKFEEKANTNDEIDEANNEKDALRALPSGYTY